MPFASLVCAVCPVHVDVVAQADIKNWCAQCESATYEYILLHAPCVVLGVHVRMCRTCRPPEPCMHARGGSDAVHAGAGRGPTPALPWRATCWHGVGSAGPVRCGATVRGLVSSPRRPGRLSAAQHMVVGGRPGRYHPSIHPSPNLRCACAIVWLALHTFLCFCGVCVDDCWRRCPNGLVPTG
jgi:hypothetical protein